MDLEMRNILNAYTLPDTELKTELEDVSCANTDSPKIFNDPESSIQEEKTSRKPPNKRKKTPEKLIIKKPRGNVSYGLDSDSDETDDNYNLCITVAPKDLENFNPRILKECGVVVNLDETKADKVEVQTLHDTKVDNIPSKKVDDEEISRKDIYVKSSNNETELIDEASVSTEVSTHSLLVTDPDTQDSNPLGLYGLRLEFLESLGITPPLDRWVHVTNFRCDKFELRDVMELAGHILSCSVININKRYAKVQYSHPLEAVQAISMLDGQMYFGLKLKVYLEKNPENDIILPKGLVNIGLGLGLQGRPVRDIVKQYRRYARDQKSAINPKLFRKSSCDYKNYNKEDHKTTDNQMDVEEFVVSSRISTFANDRSFNIKHVEDLDGNDDEKGKLAKRISSPEPHSDKSLSSPASNYAMKEDKPNDLKVTTSSTVSRLDAQENSVLSLSLNQGNSGVRLPRPNIPKNPPLQPQMSPAVPYIPCSSISHLQRVNVPYTGPFKPFCNVVPNHVPNSVIDQPFQGSAHLPMPYVPTSTQGPTDRPVNRLVHMPGPGPIPRAGTFSGSGSISGIGPISGPEFRAGPIHRPGPVPGPVTASGPEVYPGSGSVRPPISAIAAGPVTRPGPITLPGTEVGGTAGNKVTVQFANLPPSTTFPFLCEKLSQCGQILSLQFTTPGCAVVAFSHPAHAERCFHTYNGVTVEGYRINATLA